MNAKTPAKRLNRGSFLLEKWTFRLVTLLLCTAGYMTPAVVEASTQPLYEYLDFEFQWGSNSQDIQTYSDTHKIYLEETVSTFFDNDRELWGAEFRGRDFFTFVGLGDGHVATRVRHVRSEGAEWVMEEGWFFSDGTFKPFDSITYRVAKAKVQNQEPGAFYENMEGLFFKTKFVSKSFTLSTVPAFHDRTHPVVRAAFSMIRSFRTDYTSLGNFIEVYTPEGAQPELLNESNEQRFPVSGIVFQDKDFDGIQGENEIGIPGVHLRLVPAISGPPVATTRTAADGTYSFGAAIAGDYRVEVNQPLDTRTSGAPSSPVPEGEYFFSFKQPHNDPERQSLWQTTVRSDLFSLSNENEMTYVNCALVDLPVYSWDPPLARIPRPAPGEIVRFPVALTRESAWDSLQTVNFLRIPGDPPLEPEIDYELVRNLDGDFFGFNETMLFGASTPIERQLFEIAVYGGSPFEGSKVVLYEIDKDIFGRDISSKSSWLTILVEDPEPKPPLITDEIDVLYVGSIGNDTESPAIIFRNPGEPYQFGGYARLANDDGEAFFAEILEGDDGAFTIDSPLGPGFGLFSDDLAAGSFEEGGIDFMLEKVSPFGIFAPSAGLYSQENIADQDWTIFAALTPSGRFLFYSEFEGESAGGTTLFNQDGSFFIRISENSNVRGHLTTINGYHEIHAILVEGDFRFNINLRRIAKLSPSLIETERTNFAAWSERVGEGVDTDTHVGPIGEKALLLFAAGFGPNQIPGDPLLKAEVTLQNGKSKLNIFHNRHRGTSNSSMTLQWLDQNGLWQEMNESIGSELHATPVTGTDSERVHWQIPMQGEAKSQFYRLKAALIPSD